MARPSRGNSLPMPRMRLERGISKPGLRLVWVSSGSKARRCREVPFLRADGISIAGCGRAVVKFGRICSGDGYYALLASRSHHQMHDRRQEGVIGGNNED